MLPESLRGEGKEREKSLILAKAMGWEFESDCPRGFIPTLMDSEFQPVELPCPDEDYGQGYPDLYHPRNMALAWRGLGWWSSVVDIGDDDIYFQWRGWVDSVLVDDFLGKSEAQAAWLDKVLELAIAAGLVTI